MPLDWSNTAVILDRLYSSRKLVRLITLVVSPRFMRLWIILILIGTFSGSAFARLGDTEKQLIARYGRPVSTRPGGKYNPYFDKTIDFQKEGIAIACGLHSGRCVTIQYIRASGFNTLEFEGFTLLNRVGPPMFVQRSATSLKYTFKEDYPEIVKGSQMGIRRMRQQVDSTGQKN
jgi:hypothetical protein